MNEKSTGLSLNRAYPEALVERWATTLEKRFFALTGIRHVRSPRHDYVPFLAKFQTGPRSPRNAPHEGKVHSSRSRESRVAIV